MSSPDNFFRLEASWKRPFLVTLVFATFAAGLFWLDFFRVYQAEVTILVIGKTEANSTDQVVENFVELSKNLSFYERVLAENDLIDDDFAGYSKDKRKALWHETAVVQRSDKSGVLTIRVTQPTGEKARLLVESTVQSLFSLAGFYYNIKSDVDMRVVDGTILTTAVGSPFLYGVTTLSTGLLATGGFFFLLSLAPSLFRAKRPHRTASADGVLPTKPEKNYQTYEIGESVPFIDPQKFIPSRPTSLTFETPTEEEKEIRRDILSHSTKAAAPANLPVVDMPNLPVMTQADLPFQFEERGENGEGEIGIPYPESEGLSEPLQEPSVEEYKRRLNELLSGGR